MNYPKLHLTHVPTEMKKWEDKMVEAEFNGQWRSHHEYKKLYERFKKLHEEGIEHEPTF